MQRNKMHWAVTAVLMLGVSFAWAQEPSAQDMKDGAMGSMPGMSQGQMNQAPMRGMNSGGKPGAAQDMGQNMSNMNMGATSMQGGSAPPDARDPNAYSDGYNFGPIPRPHMADEHSFGSLLMERFEQISTHNNSSTEYDLQAWYGLDYDRAVLKAEGEIDGGKLQDARTELLWSHAVAPYWDTQLGMRLDGGNGPSRNWLAFGVQGLAPYWFETEATGYVGDKGRTALRLATSYELLLTQKLILQPRVEANLYGKSDPERDLGSGLSDLTAGLRLRYEIRREFAPYIGIEWVGKFGGTAELARAAGNDTKETRYVAGLRFWF
jgi:copper resistance protein B